MQLSFKKDKQSWSKLIIFSMTGCHYKVKNTFNYDNKMKNEKKKRKRMLSDFRIAN